MREILFRGKRLDNGEWVKGFLIGFIDAPFRMVTNLGTFEVDPATIGQYVGLKDKNGVKIFEGDTGFFDIDDGMPTTGTVIWWEHGWYFNGGGGQHVTLYPFNTDFEITGNIHDKAEP